MLLIGCHVRSNTPGDIRSSREGKLVTSFPRLGTPQPIKGVIETEIYISQVIAKLAMAAGVTPKLWEMADLVKVLEDWEALQVA